MARPVNPDAILATRLRDARERLGLSQREVGLLMGLSPKVAAPRINQYERGSAAPSIEDLQRLAEALGVPAALLVSEDPALVRLLTAWSDASARARTDAVRQLEARAQAAGLPGRRETLRQVEAARQAWEGTRAAAAAALKAKAAKAAATKRARKSSATKRAKRLAR